MEENEIIQLRWARVEPTIENSPLRLEYRVRQLVGDTSGAVQDQGTYSQWYEVQIPDFEE